MKKIIALSTLAILASANVHASKARLIALGENLETAGALYFSDNRNIFLNAAYVNEYKDGIYLEWGSEGNIATKLDEDASPQAEGGFLKSYNNFVYGLHIGGESYITHEARQYLRLTYAATPGAKAHQDNQIDGFFGGESGNVKWGANVTYSNTEDDTNNMKQKSASVRLGAITGKFEGFANIALMNEAELNNLTAPATNGTEKDEFEGKLGFELGGSYDLDVVKVFGYWRHAGWDQETNTGIALGSVYNGKAEFKTNRVRVGAGRVAALNEKAHLFTKLEYVMTKRGVETDDGDADIDDYSVPLTVGLEYDALSWLTLRGSVTQRLISQADNDYDDSLLAPGVISPGVTGAFRPGKRSLANTTDVNAGLTLKFGELSIDGLIGTTAGNGDVVDSENESGVLSLSNLSSRVAMSYRF
jgi:hypothetical protein